MERKKLSIDFKKVLVGLPLAGAFGTTFLPMIQRLGQQFLILIVLIWIQVFFIIECYLAGI